jgi:site-specific DNA recombinase
MAMVTMIMDNAAQKAGFLLGFRDQEAKGGRFAYYVCGTLLKKGAGTCPARYLSARRFESLVIDKIKEHILTEENLTKLVGLVNEEMGSFATGYRSRLGTVDSELADVNRRLGHLYDALETGKLSLEDLAPRIQNLRHRQDQLEAAKQDIEDALLNRKAELADLDTVIEYVEDLKTALMNSPLTERRVFIRSFVKEVKVTGDEALLSYTIPLPPSSIVEEKAGVLSIVQHGSGGWIRTNDLRVINPTIFK